MNPGFNKILEEYQQLTEQLSSGDNVDLATLGRRQSELLPIVEKIEAIKSDEEFVSKIARRGAEKARESASATVNAARKAIGIRHF